MGGKPFYYYTSEGKLFLKNFTNKKEESIIFPFQKQVYSKKIISVAGVAHGLGTTHISLTLANYVCSKLGMKTAYIELNSSGHICALSPKKEKPFFTYKGIVFYPNTNVTSLSELLHKDYQYFILDMGVLNTYSIAEFLRCDKPFLVCSPSKWRRSQSQEQLEKAFQNYHYQHCKLIMNLCEKESQFSPLLAPCEHIPFPYFRNPFQIESKNFHAINSMVLF